MVIIATASVSLAFNIFLPPSRILCTGDLAKAITSSFGSFDDFKVTASLPLPVKNFDVCFTLLQNTLSCRHVHSIET